jgi:GTP-binding protein
MPIDINKSSHRPLTVTFEGSFPDVEKCPKDTLPEFAFIGRSNVGKSSIINLVTSRQGIAKVSSKPGKTRLLNFFKVFNDYYLVDLPGYGYAKISQKERRHLKKMTEDYILKRAQLWNLFLLIDSRHPPMARDLQFISWLGEHEVPFIILFTKCDKLNQIELYGNLEQYRKKLSNTWEVVPTIISTSAKKREGKDVIIGIIQEIIDANTPKPEIKLRYGINDRRLKNL